MKSIRETNAALLILLASHKNSNITVLGRKHVRHKRMCIFCQRLATTQPTSQSTDQPINQPGQPINQPINQSTNQPTNQSTS
jgi:hypothetical protein